MSERTVCTRNKLAEYGTFGCDITSDFMIISLALGTLLKISKK